MQTSQPQRAASAPLLSHTFSTLRVPLTIKYELMRALRHSIPPYIYNIYIWVFLCMCVGVRVLVYRAFDSIIF